MVNLRQQPGLQVCFAVLIYSFMLSSVCWFFNLFCVCVLSFVLLNFWGGMETPGMDQDLSDLMKDKSGSRWGNKFGMVLLPVYYHKSGADPLKYLERAKVMIDRKKHSLEAHFSYQIGYLIMTYLGSKVETKSISIELEKEIEGCFFCMIDSLL